ncbi:MAG: HAMP domain-containing protein [Candidatus Omnitrophica bacterium]|nr:HAMP domain-containing protein [Candidatus Omnitrophota bacterium]
MNNRLIKKLTIQIIIIVVIIAAVFSFLISMQTKELKSRIIDKAGLFSSILGAHLDNIIENNLRAYEALQQNVVQLTKDNQDIEEISIIAQEKVVIAASDKNLIGKVPEFAHIAIIDDVIKTKRSRAIVSSELGREIVIHFLPLFAADINKNELLGIMQMKAKFPSQKGEIVTALRKNRNAYYKEEALRFATSLSKSLEIVLGEVKRNSTYLDELISNMLKDKEIRDIKIFLKDLEFLISATKGRGNLALTEQEKSIFLKVMQDEKIMTHTVGKKEYLTEIISPLYISLDNQKKSLGAVGIVISAEQVTSLIRIRRNYIILMSFVIICAFVLIIGIFFKLSIIRPIRDLINMTKGIALGDFSKKVMLAANDEIGDLTKAFNHMADELSSSKQEIEDWNLRLQDKIEAVTKDLNAKQQMLIESEKMASLGVLSAGIAHEINNPLGVILGHAQMLIKELKEKKSLDNPQESIQMLETIESYTRRCSYIVNSLIQFAREKQMQMIDVDVNQAIENALIFTQNRISNKSIEIVKTLEENLPNIAADQIHLEQVFINIILNAEASMPQGGSLKISTQKTNAQIKVLFEDNGQGISKDDMNRIFEPFFSTKDPGKGSGLGLSLSYGIIQAHGGDIKIVSKKNKGTLVEVLLPLKG